MLIWVSRCLWLCYQALLHFRSSPVLETTQKAFIMFGTVVSVLLEDHIRCFTIRNVWNARTIDVEGVRWLLHEFQGFKGGGGF